jgi:hypothetical protein
MTDDLGPGAEFADDLSTFFDAYRIPASGLASERDADEAAALLGGATRVDARFADFPVTSSGGQSMASVEVTLHVPSALADQATAQTPVTIAELLNQVVQPDGYRVSEVVIASDS